MECQLGWQRLQHFGGVNDESFEGSRGRTGPQQRRATSLDGSSKDLVHCESCSLHRKMVLGRTSGTSVIALFTTNAVFALHEIRQQVLKTPSLPAHLLPLVVVSRATRINASVDTRSPSQSFSNDGVHNPIFCALQRPNGPYCRGSAGRVVV